MTQAANPDAASLNVNRFSIAVVTLKERAFPEIRRHLAPAFKTILASTEEEIQVVVSDSSVHGLVFDLDSIGDGAEDGIEVLQEIRKLREDLVLAAMTESTDSGLSLKASQAGIDEFFVAPVDLSRLREVMLLAVEKRALQHEGRWLLQLVENKSAFCGLIGGSEAMRKLYRSVEAVAGSNASVVIRGESGAGKELVARAIVQSGERNDQTYICLNCSALPESLIESELFGYEKGAFTGADSAKPGMVELAHGGTLFLDEITTLHLGLQSKLLRVLQERSVQRLGGKSAKKIDFRLITATNEDLEDLVQKGRFREDLYYRINVVPIFVPPLRERTGDIPLLVEHFLRMHCTANKKPVMQLQPEIMDILEAYSWPGNVRELDNIVQRLVVMSDGSAIAAHHLPQQLLTSSAASQEAILIPVEGVEFDVEMERIEIAYLSAALRRSGGNKAAAARLLHIDGQRMKYLCRKLKL
ncbi:MAG TPA: sigma-54 dependent transcriptional regulator [Candidatus Angelobacter sp.]|nr:sigma-54 dependent transcriptional regulator [Candidatus Angelobacter sp.]